MTVRQIQQALVDARFDPGPIDGIRGRRTIAAIKAFQREHGLVADGIVGPITAAVLFKTGVPPTPRFEVPSTMPWLEEAVQLLGIRERPGVGSSAEIMNWARTLGIREYTDDDIAWCGLFVAHCTGSQLPEEPLPTDPLVARRWSGFGVPTTPRVGAVMVFWRKSRQSGLGHVGLYWAQDERPDGAYLVLGGNQGDKVSFAWVEKRRFLEARWPRTAPPPTLGTRIADSDGQLLSQNEA
jgi:uncharacterized protein (TIGR02594 family)